MEGKQVRNLASGRPIHLVGSSQLARVEGLEVLRLDGKTSGLIRGDLSHADMPVETFSVEAWVRVDEPLSWGGIIGAIQDNGSYEKGWLLGFQDQRFSFALNGQGGPDRFNTWQQIKILISKGGITSQQVTMASGCGSMSMGSQWRNPLSSLGRFNTLPVLFMK